MNLLRKIVSVTAATLILWVTAVQSHTDFAPGMNLFSAQQDAELGRQSAAQVDRQLPMLNSGAAARLVDRLGQRLASAAPGPSFSYRFRVVNLADVNAFALPGGYVYVHRGLIERVRSEGELAGVMAHEIAHVALRHPTRQASKVYVAQTGLSLLQIFFGHGSTTRTSQIVNALGGVGLNSLFLKYSRSAESEADALGARIMAQAGYDPNEMADFFAILRTDAGRDPNRFAVFMSDHPAPADRETHIRTEARGIQVRSASSIGGLAYAQGELRDLPPARRMSEVVSRTGSGAFASR